MRRDRTRGAVCEAPATGLFRIAQRRPTAMGWRLDAGRSVADRMSPRPRGPTWSGSRWRPLPFASPAAARPESRAVHRCAVASAPAPEAGRARRQRRFWMRKSPPPAQDACRGPRPGRPHRRAAHSLWRRRQGRPANLLVREASRLRFVCSDESRRYFLRTGPETMIRQPKAAGRRRADLPAHTGCGGEERAPAGVRRPASPRSWRGPLPR